MPNKKTMMLLHKIKSSSTSQPTQMYDIYVNKCNKAGIKPVDGRVYENCLELERQWDELEEQKQELDDEMRYYQESIIRYKQIYKVGEKMKSHDKEMIKKYDEEWNETRRKRHDLVIRKNELLNQMRHDLGGSYDLFFTIRPEKEKEPRIIKPRKNYII
jgi:DNA polymerase II small subunit/DNA polymerase delta subunit B